MIKWKKIPILKIMVFSVVCVGVGYLVAILIARISKLGLQDALFYEGLIIIMLGLMLSMKGNPSGANLQGLGQQSAQQISSWNLEVTRIERNKTNYYRDFLKHSIVDFAFGNLALMLGGVLIIMISIVFF